MPVIRLEGEKKEKYLKNLNDATKYLIKKIKEDNTLKKSEWDNLVYEEIIKMLDQISNLFYLLKRIVDEDYKNNFGVYTDVVLSNGGLPEFFSYRQLIDDKNKADEKIRSILDTEEISTKEELAKKWIENSNKYWEKQEDKKKYLLEIIPEKYQAIEFYERLKIVPLFDITKPMENLSVKYFIEKKEKKCNISWFNYVLGNGVWNLYIANIMKKERKKSLFNKNDDELDLFKKFLEDHMNSGVLFLARDIDKMFPTIYPERISMFQFGPNFVEGIGENKSFLSLIKNDEFFLTAQREDIKNSGKNNDKLISGKYIWKSDKIMEERFGICSKELEKPLKEIIKIPNMRFYTI